MFYAALCFAGGFFISALGVHLHQISIVYLGYGVIGGVGLGLGYISPVSTLIKWFPDRRGMATGIAIMGFGGGAMIGSPLAVSLMEHSSRRPVGVETFVDARRDLLLFMMMGAVGIRIPPPASRRRATAAGAAQEAHHHRRHVDEALKTPQFWLLWAVLCVNVTAGIGVLGQASAMIQEMFPGRIGAVAAAGFVGLLSSSI